MQDLINQVAAIAELRKEATPGPWELVVKGNSIQSQVIPGVCSGISLKTGNGAFLKAVEALDFAQLAGQLSNYVSVMETNQVLAARLAATPAPLADAELAELEQAYTEAAPVLWGVHIGEYDDVLIFEDENGDGYRPNPYHPICKMEDLGDEKQEAYAVLIKCLVNAAPALLARGRQAEAVRPWISTEALPVLPADCPTEYWVCYPDETVGTLYWGYRIEMDENWDEDEPYTGWMYEGTGEGLSVYSGPQPLYYKEMEPAPAAPTVKGGQPHA